MNLLKETFNDLSIDEIYERVEWLRIRFEYYVDAYDDETGEYIEIRKPSIRLAPGYDMQQLAEAMEKMNYNYDNGYGSQEICGCVKFRDGSWLERCEYDGSEWWEHRSVPTW